MSMERSCPLTMAGRPCKSENLDHFICGLLRALKMRQRARYKAGCLACVYAKALVRLFQSALRVCHPAEASA